jgi:AcrR family transcriptional regulator
MSDAAVAPREPLTARRVIAGAVELADRIGVDAVTIRRLADHLGVRPMSIYHHVAGKEAIVDGMVEAVFDEIERPPAGLPWRDAIRHRSRSARAALRRHPWAPPLMESRVHPGAGILDHHEAVLAVWFGAGFPLGLVAHANAVVDAFVYGFALQEAALPFGEHEGRLSDEAAEIVVPLVPDRYPHLIRFAREHALQPDYDFGRSFEFGLDVVLDGLERALAATRGP